jgi:hypothetical protein
MWAIGIPDKQVMQRMAQQLKEQGIEMEDVSWQA